MSNTSIGTIIPLDFDTMMEYLDMWAEAVSDKITALDLNIEDVEAFYWNDETDDRCENLHFAIQVAGNSYWTSFGFAERDGNSLTLLN